MKNKLKSVPVLLFTVLLPGMLLSFSYEKTSGPSTGAKATHKKEYVMDKQLKISMNNKVAYAEFEDSKTTREFIALLPLTLTMDDLSGREKYSVLPKALSKEGKVSTSFQEGDLSYWLGGGIAAFYNNDGHEVKAGLIVLAKLGKGIEHFKGPEALTVKFEAVNK